MSSSEGDGFTGAWNFGPTGDPVSVSEIVIRLSEITGGKNYQLDTETHPHEAQALMLDSSKARQLLGWKPQLNLDTALRMTFDWFDHSLENSDMSAFTKSQIRQYRAYG